MLARLPTILSLGRVKAPIVHAHDLPENSRMFHAIHRSCGFVRERGGGRGYGFSAAVCRDLARTSFAYI